MLLTPFLISKKQAFLCSRTMCGRTIFNASIQLLFAQEFGTEKSVMSGNKKINSYCCVCNIFKQCSLNYDLILNKLRA